MLPPTFVLPPAEDSVSVLQSHDQIVDPLCRGAARVRAMLEDEELIEGLIDDNELLLELPVEGFRKVEHGQRDLERRANAIARRL